MSTNQVSNEQCASKSMSSDPFMLSIPHGKTTKYFSFSALYLLGINSHWRPDLVLHHPSLSKLMCSNITIQNFIQIFQSNNICSWFLTANALADHLPECVFFEYKSLKCVVCMRYKTHRVDLKQERILHDHGHITLLLVQLDPC